MDSLGITVFASLLLCVIAWGFLYKLRAASGNVKKQQQQRFHPIAGTMLHQVWNFRRLHDYHTELSHKYKTFRLLAPFRNQIYTVDPVIVEYILRTNFASYGKGWLNHQNLSAFFGDGIFAVDGEKWRHQRKLASHDFSTRVLRDFSSIVFKNNATKLAQIVSDASRSDLQMDIQDLLMRSTMDSIFKIGFGVDLNSLDGSNKEGTRFAKAFDYSSVSIRKRYTDITWKLKRFLNIGSEADLKKNIKLIDNFLYKLIHSRMESTSSQNSDLVKREDILSRFLLEREKDPETMSLQYLRDIILNFLIAGRDTTAGTLAWFFYMICKHPSIQEKIAREIKEAVQADEKMSFIEFPRNITEEALLKMKYLHAALSETLRLYPAVPMDTKVCFSDDTLPDGFNVKKGDAVIYLPYPMGRMPFLWGNDPEIFRPERWFDENGVFQPESPFKFTAFQAGPRICLGREFAYRQMKIFAAVLLHFFKFKLSDEKKIVNYKTMITLQIEDGLVIQAQHRGFM